MRMATRVLVIIIVILDSSFICAPTSTSTETATVTTPTAGALPPACAGGVGQLGKQYTIVSTRPYTALVWVRLHDGRYVVTCNPSCSPIAGYRATINASHTTLTIDSLTQDDVGGWGLLNATQVGAAPVTVCRLSAVRLPQCSIISDENTDSLEPGTQLTLTVNITGYYCSVEAVFNLTTGHVTEELIGSHKVSNISDLSVNKTFSVDVRRLGDVTLNFVCDRIWKLTCNGVQELFKSPPRCTISGDTDTNALVPGTNLTLSVDINNYYCPRETGFNLTTGHVTEELIGSHKVSDISDLSVNKTFSVDVRRLGDVTLNFVCDRIWKLTCNGVQGLFKSPPQCNISGDTDTNALVPGTNLTLSVDIKNIYCPRETGFNLTTGHVTEELSGSHKVSDISDLSVNKTFSVDVRRLGDVTLNFVCDRIWKLTCNGVQELFKSPPRCTISGDTDTNALVPGTNLTLSVDINNYYCPRETGFNLTTGHVTEELIGSHKVSDISDLSVNKTFSVDVRRLGDVTLNFVCDRIWKLTCNGVQELFKSPPQCNISGDTDTNALVPGTNLTLSVDIKNIYCWRNTGFVLTTGGVDDVLLQNQTTNNITDTAVTTSFVVRADHLGDVRVIYMCDNTNISLTCGGVYKLTAVSSTQESITSTADFQTKEPITMTAGPSTRAGASAATAGLSTRTGSVAATELSRPMGASSPTLTQETSALPTVITGTASVSLNVGIIVLIVEIVIVFLVVIVVTIVCCRKKYHAYRLAKLQNATALQTS
ncbi:uncharacterized protein [Haliotis asinina]|uniref:uncharacterized protein isoform X2 n=1 Tax=Haliotis asinina TaxID=109174 RepID=UPI003531B403